MPPQPRNTDAGALGYDVQSTSPEETTALGQRLAASLNPGDTIMLSGQLGAGKSHFARAAIRALLGQPDADVPSPSYTLVNVYERAADEIWHADLYRLGTVEDLIELGLDEATSDAIVLVEWAERWQPPPARRLGITLRENGPDARVLSVLPVGGNWSAALLALGVTP